MSNVVNLDDYRTEDRWYCKCGNDLFRLTRECLYCPICERWQYGWDEE